MTIHLIKLSVGPANLQELIDWQQSHLKSGRKRELMHVTRQMPKRTEELLNGGSIYWVIKGVLCARQKLVDLRPLEIDGVPHCGIIYQPEIIRVIPRPHRPFQGWRYLTTKDAPADMPLADGYQDLPEDMLKELAELGLL